MDLWDLAKLLLRRWAVSLPLMLLTVAGTIWTASTVQPDYSAVGNMTLLPPTTEQPVNPEEARTVNPWDTFQLAGVVLIHANSKSLKDQFEAEGFDGDWEASADERYGTVISVNVTAASEREAREIMRRLLEVIADEVELRQDEYNLPEGQRISTVIFDDVFDVQAVTGKVKRALVVVFGIGLIMTVALTVSFDAVLRRRQARRTSAASRTSLTAHAIARTPLVTHATAQGIRVRVAPLSSPGESSPRTERAASGSRGRARGAAAVPSAAGEPGSAGADSPASGAPSEPIDETTVLSGAVETDEPPNGSAAAPGPNGTADRPLADDSTIVLPFNGAHWPDRDLPRAGRPSETHPR